MNWITFVDRLQISKIRYVSDGFRYALSAWRYAGT